MQPTDSPSISIEEVPAHLAAQVERKFFAWHETPRLRDTKITMRELCMTVMREFQQGMSEGSDVRAHLNRHEAMFAHIVYVTLQSAMNYLPQHKPDAIRTDVRYVLENVFRHDNARGPIELGKDHPFADDPRFSAPFTKTEKSWVTKRVVQKTKRGLTMSPGYRQAVDVLRNDDAYLDFLSQKLPQLFHPGADVIRGLPDDALAILDRSGLVEDDRRTALVDAVTDFCNHRYPDLATRIGNAIGQYSLRHSRQPGNDEIITILTNVHDHSLQSSQAEKDLRPVLMSLLIMLANNPRKTLMMENRPVAVHTLLRSLVEEIWPAILRERKVPVSECREAAIAAVAVSARVDPLEALRDAMQYLKEPPKILPVAGNGKAHTPFSLEKPTKVDLSIL